MLFKEKFDMKKDEPNEKVLRYINFMNEQSKYIHKVIWKEDTSWTAICNCWVHWSHKATKDENVTCPDCLKLMVITKYKFFHKFANMSTEERKEVCSLTWEEVYELIQGYVG